LHVIGTLFSDNVWQPNGIKLRTMITIPPYLKQGNTIGILCPSGFMSYEKAQTSIDVLQQWGYKIKTGSTLGNQLNYFSGTDEQRLNDLQQMLDDDTIHAIFCARGGYGLSRIIDNLSFKKFRRHPKWIIGFSDITILQLHLCSNDKIASLHAPMASAFNNDGFKNSFVQSIQKALSGQKINYQSLPHSFNREGEIKGRLIGGNLSLIAHLCGTSSEIKTKGKILFIEDVGEYIYNIDRMLYQLKRAGKLDKLAGLIVGGFTDIKDTTVPFGQTVYEAIRDAVKEYDYPVCFNFPVSHGMENYALKIGVKHELTVSNKSVTLEEL
jgi:muramoyltetrapeptide carboxypeptidase